MAKHRKRGGQPFLPMFDDPRTARAQGMEAFARGEYDTAIAVWSGVARNAPDQRLEHALAEAHFRRACQTLSRHPDRALEDLRAACELRPEEARYHYQRGLAHHRRGELIAAVAAYRDSLGRGPEDASRVAFGLCLALGELGYNPAQDPAWELLTPEQRERLIPADPAFGEAMARLAAGDFAGAEPLLARSLGVQRGVAHYYLGVIAWRRGDHDEALARWLSARAAGFNTPALRHNLAVAYAERASRQIDSPALAEIVRAGLKLAPDSPMLRRLRQYVAFLAGNRQAEAGNWRAALSHWQAARNATGQPGQAPRELLANIALAYERLGRWMDAADAWREVIRRRPRSGEQLWTPLHTAQLWAHIDSLYAQAGHFDRAVTTLRYAIKSQPDDLTLRLALVRRHLDNQNWRAARAAALGVLEIAPGNPEAGALYAQALDQSGDLDLMIEAWEQVLKAPASGFSGMARERLRRLYPERGDFYASIDDLDAAVADYGRAVALAPDDARLQARYGALLARTAPDSARAIFERLDLRDEDVALTVITAWRRAGDPGEAERWLARLSGEGDGPPARLLVALGAGLLPDDPAAAEACFAQVMARLDGAPEAAGLLTSIGTAHAACDRIAEAYAYARRALQADPGFGPAHLNLGLWDAAKGRRQAAGEHLRAARAWAEAIRRSDIAEGIEEAINLLAERYTPTLADVLDTIDPDGEDDETRRLLGGLLELK
jgi:tetratricopeptide (TPR) repeat protein